MNVAQNQHLAWLARSFGRPDYLPLEESDLEALAAIAEPISRYRGSHLFREGDPAEAAFVLQSGEVDIYRHHSGHKRVISRVGPGTVLGDIAMFGGGTYLSSAQAVGHVRAFRFHREQLLQELARHPALCLRWLVAAVQQLERTQRRVIHLMHKTVLAQTADLLLEECPQPGEVRLSQATIATLLGATRQTVNEALAVLRQLGAVETGYRAIRVREPGLLRQVAAGELP